MYIYFFFLHIFDIVFACLVISFLSEMFLVQLQYWWKVFCLYPRKALNVRAEAAPVTQ